MFRADKSQQDRSCPTLKQERCPRCGARLFDADAEGYVEIRCRKCKYLVRRTLQRVGR